MTLKPFGEDKGATFHQVTLGECSGHLEELIEIEAERPMSDRGPLQLRLDIIQRADELLQIAINADPRVMRETLQKLNIIN